MKYLDIFAEINQVPRPSKHEEQIRAWLLHFAREHNLQSKTDEIGNVLISCPATAGYESHPKVGLQAHMDMVCEKNADVQFDFFHDAIQTYIDGNLMKAKGTTLGADDGIGISFALALMTEPGLKHPALEALFTVDEETGLTGAFNLGKDMLTCKTLINLDSEDDAQVFIGCAGGIDTLATWKQETENTPADQFCATYTISGLIGGHSGDDINKGHANANKLMARYLFAVQQSLAEAGCADALRIAQIDGGNLRNAIAHDATVTFCVPMAQKHNLVTLVNQLEAAFQNEYGAVETTLSAKVESAPLPAETLTTSLTKQLIQALYACPHGVYTMSHDMPGLVETSTNLASIKMRDEKVVIATSQRSSIETQKVDMMNMVRVALEMAGAQVEHTEGYPGWKPNVHSPLLEVSVKAFEDLYHEQPEVKAIHAGLECGLFLEMYPELDMVSIGPQLYGVHSPSEAFDLVSGERTWRWVVRMLEML